MINESVYFFPDDTNVKLYKKIIKTQGDEVCRDVITKQWITDCVSKLSFGLAKLKKDTADEYYLLGFILCRIDIENDDKLFIDLVCAREKSACGKQLHRPKRKMRQIS